MTLQIATWNLNSIKARHDRLLALLQRRAPDVLCLQELKVEESNYPFLEISALGYTSAVNAQKTYNGVAILSKHAMTDVSIGLADGVEDPQARLIAATIQGVRVICVYVPNGESLESEKWPYKLRWYERLRAWLDKNCSPDQPLALCGDFNVSPEAIDTYDPVGGEKEVLFHPQARAALANVTSFGLVDTCRRMRPNEVVYTWWDYRMLGFPKNKGMRIDHILATPSLANRCMSVIVDRDERKGDGPSDHAPLISTFS